MRVKTIIDEDFVNYKKPAMFIGTISCGGKCCREADLPLSVCQNDELRSRPNILVDDDIIIRRYLTNEITQAFVIGGLEPFEQTDEVVHFVDTLRTKFKRNDDVVIYTGYYPDEKDVQYAREVLSHYPNIIVKWGRYIPNKPAKIDDVLGINLASDNQFAEVISDNF